LADYWKQNYNIGIAIRESAVGYFELTAQETPFAAENWRTINDAFTAGRRSVVS
jgi:hypothetical protein